MITYRHKSKEVAKIIIFANFIVKMAILKGDEVQTATTNFYGEEEELAHQFKNYIHSFLFNEKLQVKEMLRRLVILSTNKKYQ